MKHRQVQLLKVPVFLLCLWPLAGAALGAFGLAGFSLGANPVEALIDTAGTWGLNFLLITLAVTPLAQITHRAWLLRFRRMLGLFAFFYVCLHFLVYAGLDQGFQLAWIGEDIVERPFITIGMLAFLLLLPLAVTSTQGQMRRLGRRWKVLHRLVYLIAGLGVWHFFWQVKLDTLQPLIYTFILLVLLGYRVIRRWRRKPPARPVAEDLHERTAHAG